MKPPGLRIPSRESFFWRVRRVIPSSEAVPGPVPPVPVEDLANRVLLGLGDDEVQLAPGVGCGGEVEIPVADRLVPVQLDDRTSDPVLELADVAGPVVAPERAQRAGGEARHGPGLGPVGPAQDVAGQERDVGPTLAEGRDADRELVEPVVEVGPEGAGLHRRGQRAVGRGDDPDVDATGVIGAHPGDLPELEGPEQEGLDRGGQVPDLVQEERAAGRGREATHPGAGGAREGPPLVTEELGRGQGLGDRRALDDLERPPRPGRQGVDRPGHQLLARPALALDEDRGGGARGALDPAPQDAHRLRSPQEAVGGAPALLLVQPPLQPPPVHGPANQRHELRRRDRLHQEVLDAAIEGVARGLEALQAGQDDDLRPSGSEPDPVEGEEALPQRPGRREHQVEHHHVGRVVREGAQEGAAITGRGRGVAGVADPGREPLADERLVLDDEDVGGRVGHGAAPSLRAPRRASRSARSAGRGLGSGLAGRRGLPAPGLRRTLLGCRGLGVGAGAGSAFSALRSLSAFSMRSSRSSRSMTSSRTRRIFELSLPRSALVGMPKVPDTVSTFLSTCCFACMARRTIWWKRSCFISSTMSSWAFSLPSSSSFVWRDFVEPAIGFSFPEAGSVPNPRVPEAS